MAEVRAARRPGWALWVLAAAALLLLLWDGARRPPAAYPAETRHEFDTMRTQAHFVILAAPGLAVPPAEIMAEAEAAVREVERLMNPYREGSDVWRLNRAKPGEWVSVHPLTWRVVMEALRFHRLSGGAFDPTIGPLKQLYFPGGKPRGDLPTEEERREARAKVGAEKLRYEREGMRLAWEASGMMLDLSALAKGFAVDRAMEVFLERGVRDGMVEIGGELRLAGTVPQEGLSRQRVGTKPGAEGAAGDAPADADQTAGRRPWRLEVLDPRNPDLPQAERQYLARTNGAVATSGDYEQYFEIGGKRYSHLIDPRIGMPVTSAVAATVVLPGECMQADALATTLCVLGPDAGKAFIEARTDDLFASGVEAFIFHLVPGDAPGRARRRDVVVPGEGLERMRDPKAVPAAEEGAEELARETQWLDRVLGQ